MFFPSMRTRPVRAGILSINNTTQNQIGIMVNTPARTVAPEALPSPLATCLTLTLKLYTNRGLANLLAIGLQ